MPEWLEIEGRLVEVDSDIRELRADLRSMNHLATRIAMLELMKALIEQRTTLIQAVAKDTKEMEPDEA